MSLKIAKEKAQRNLFLCVIICSALVQALAKWLALTPVTADAQEAAGKPHEPWPSSKACDAPGAENTEAYWYPHSCKETAPAGKVPPEEPVLVVSTPSRASPPHLKRQGAFSHLWPHISPKSVNKAKRKVKCQEQGVGCISPGMSGMWERRAGKQRKLLSQTPLHFTRWWGTTSLPWCSPVQPLCPAAWTCCDVGSWEIQRIWPHCFSRGD